MDPIFKTVYDSVSDLSLNDLKVVTNILTEHFGNQSVSLIYHISGTGFRVVGFREFGKDPYYIPGFDPAKNQTMCTSTLVRPETLTNDLRRLIKTKEATINHYDVEMNFDKTKLFSNIKSQMSEYDLLQVRDSFEEAQGLNTLVHAIIDEDGDFVGLLGGPVTLSPVFRLEELFDDLDSDSELHDIIAMTCKRSAIRIFNDLDDREDLKESDTIWLLVDHNENIVKYVRSMSNNEYGTTVHGPFTVGSVLTELEDKLGL